MINVMFVCHGRIRSERQNHRNTEIFEDVPRGTDEFTTDLPQKKSKNYIIRSGCHIAIQILIYHSFQLLKMTQSKNAVFLKIRLEYA